MSDCRFLRGSFPYLYAANAFHPGGRCWECIWIKAPSMREPLVRGGGALFLFLTSRQVIHRFAAAGEVADFGKALGDGRVGVVGVGGLLDVVRAVLVDHVEAVVRLAGECVVHGRGIVAEGLVACHNSHLSDSVCRIAPIMQKKRAVPWAAPHKKPTPAGSAFSLLTSHFFLALHKVALRKNCLSGAKNHLSAALREKVRRKPPADFFHCFLMRACLCGTARFTGILLICRTCRPA